MSSVADRLNDSANVLKRCGRRKEALATYRRAIDLDPAALHPRYNLAKMRREDGAVEEAMYMLDGVIAMDPSYYRARHDRAVCLEELGRFDEASEQYRDVLRDYPAHIKALANLIALGSFRGGEALIARAHRALASGNCNLEDRARLHCSLGKYYDRMGEFDTAFAHFAQSNAEQNRGGRPADPSRLARACDEMIAALDATCFRARAREGVASDVPVFVVGMPRSGTTLVEQILASHSEVHGAGERTEIPRIVEKLGAAYPNDIARLEPTLLDSQARVYREANGSIVPQGIRRVVDKRPGNFMHLGLIAMLFPEATLIHCRRHPLDVVLSCFIERFASARGFGTHLESIACCIVQHERLMAHWRAVLPRPIYQCDYATLVSDSEVEMQRLVAHCGLEWQSRCLEFFRTQRRVDTPSRWQVRQPIYRSSVGRWRNYQRHLAPAAEVLERAGVTCTLDGMGHHS